MQTISELVDETCINVELVDDIDPSENSTLYPELKMEDEKFQAEVNRSVRKKRKVYYSSHKVKRTADSYLNTEQRKLLAQTLQDKARSHKLVRLTFFFHM